MNNLVKNNPMWGGRFKKSPTKLMQDFNQSISFDKRLYQQDIAASIVHCQMLVKQNIITSDEGDKIIDGLNQVKAEISNGEFKFDIALEDIHMNIEARLKQIIGDVAGKLHTARSRNDQVATDFRLWVKDSIDNIIELINDLQSALVNQAKANLTVLK